MGVYIHLDIRPLPIPADAWRDFYDQAKTFLTEDPSTLIGLRQETHLGEKRFVYSTQLEQEGDNPDEGPFLRISGDLTSMETVESFFLYQRFEHYRSRVAARGIMHASPELASSVQTGIPEHDAADVISVFSAKTQGAPYHFPILAVAILAEQAFPGHAWVSGDIDRAQCEKAVGLLQERLGLEVALPLCVNPPKLFAACFGESPTIEEIRLFFERCRDTADGLRYLYRNLPRELMLDWLASDIGEYGGKVTLGVERSLREWIEATEDLDELVAAIAARPAQFGLDASLLARALAGIGITLGPEPVPGLEHLDRPAGAPDRVYTQFGNALFDMMGLSARHCRHRLGLEAVAASLARHFPADSHTTGEPTWREALETVTRAQEDNLAHLGNWLNTLMQDREEHPELDEHDGESFIAYRDGDPLTSFQDTGLRMMGAMLAPRWDEWRETIGDLLARLDCASDDSHPQPTANPKLNLDKRRRILMRMVRKRSIALTEAGWRWIDSEGDDKCLDTLFMVCSANPGIGQLENNILRGLLEHRALCQQLLTYILAPPAEEQEAVSQIVAAREQQTNQPQAHDERENPRAPK